MAKTETAPLTLDAVRARIDEIDTDLLRLLAERGRMADAVATAKIAAGDAARFGLRPGRETQILRRLLALPHEGASTSLIVRVWRELMGESLALQGHFSVSYWGGSDPGRIGSLARMRFGAAPGLVQVDRPEDAIAAAKSRGGVGVCALARDSAWWGRLLAEPKLKVFAGLPCFAGWGPMSALAFAAVEIEPTGEDRTFWVTDATESSAEIREAMGRDGVAATLLAQAGGLKLFALAGYYMAADERLARAPGKLSGVIGAAPVLGAEP